MDDFSTRADFDRLAAPYQQTISGTQGRLVARKVLFDWSQTPLEWIPQQPFASHLINQINLILPAGELWFCRLFNQALPLITDAKLRDDVQQFVRQEGMHAQAHVGVIESYLKQHGVDTLRNTRIMEFLFDVVLADQPFGRKLPRMLQRRWLLFRLGIVASVEHMTCVLGRYALENKQWDAAGADPSLVDLIRWHGAEEIEHRSVAFDLYRHLGGRYASRFYLTAITFPLVFGLWMDGAAHLMQQDPQFAADKPRAWRPWFWRQWKQAQQAGLLPSVGWLLAKEMPFLNPWYDPLYEASTEDAMAYLMKSPAAAAGAAARQTVRAEDRSPFEGEALGAGPKGSVCG